jgi:hypothetical protein
MHFNGIVEEEALKQVVNRMHMEDKNARNSNNKAKNKYMPSMKTSADPFAADEIKFKPRVYTPYNN